MKIINVIVRIKPLYRTLKKIKRKLIGISEDSRCLSKKEVNFLLEYAKEGGYFLEVGCAFGQTTKTLSKKGFVVAIDPFPFYERNQVMGEYFEDIVVEFMKNIQGENICFFPLKSEDVEHNWKRFVNKKFDFIFIDGLHTYEQIKKDYAWVNHLKEDGYILFHDTNMPQIDKFIKEKPMKELDLIEQFSSIKVFRKKRGEN